MRRNLGEGYFLLWEKHALLEKETEKALDQDLNYFTKTNINKFRAWWGGGSRFTAGIHVPYKAASCSINNTVCSQINATFHLISFNI